MELCISQPISTVPRFSTTTSTAISTPHIRRRSSPISPHTSIPRSLRPLLSSRSPYFHTPVPRAAASDETASGVSSYVAVEEKEVNSSGSEPAEGEVVVVGEEALDDFLASLNTKLEDDPYSVVLYGSGALLTLWLTSVIVGAIDSIPLFPKLMEVVGLFYSFWFAYRYLLFKKDRDELAGIIEGFKKEILGSNDD